MELSNVDLQGKRVFLRADLNVPIKNNKIVNDHKIKSILPTIELLKKKGAKIILGTHIGRPKKYDPQFSTVVLAEWFKKNGYSVVFEPDLQKAIQKSLKSTNDIIVLENLRFFPEETNEDPDFAKKLKNLADFYVNDAFGILHRNDTSITLLPKMFEQNKLFIGPLIKNELKILDNLLFNAQKPITLILGGKKVSSKLPLIENLLNKVQTILLCPAIVFTFSKYLGKKVGNSLVDEKSLPIVPRILKKAKELKVNLFFPVDYQVAKKTFDGPVSNIDSENIPENFFGLSIGPKTTGFFKKEIQKSKTVMFNGSFGNIKKIETYTGMKNIFDSMANSKLFTIIGGGDSVAAAHLLGVADSIDHLSTGGGSMLYYLSGKKLPGLKVFDI